MDKLYQIYIIEPNLYTMNTIYASAVSQKETHELELYIL